MKRTTIDFKLVPAHEIVTVNGHEITPGGTEGDLAFSVTISYQSAKAGMHGNGTFSRGGVVTPRAKSTYADVKAGIVGWAASVVNPDPGTICVLHFELIRNVTY